MAANSALFLECHLAGVAYHEATMVWPQLMAGVAIRLVRDRHNSHDGNAVAVTIISTVDGQEYVLGYLPRSSNQAIAPLLDMGWGSIFEARIGMVNPTAHYEEQIRIIVRVKQKPQF